MPTQSRLVAVRGSAGQAEREARSMGPKGFTVDLGNGKFEVRLRIGEAQGPSNDLMIGPQVFRKYDLSEVTPNWSTQDQPGVKRGYVSKGAASQSQASAKASRKWWAQNGDAVRENREEERKLNAEHAKKYGHGMKQRIKTEDRVPRIDPDYEF